SSSSSVGGGDGRASGVRGGRASSSTGGSESSYDIEEYNRFFAAKGLGGSGGGLGLPNPVEQVRSGGKAKASKRASEMMEALALAAAEFDRAHGTGVEDRGDGEWGRAGDVYSPWDEVRSDQEPTEEDSDEEIYAFVGRKPKRSQRSAGRQAVCSGAEFEWEEVDFEDPLGPYGSLLARLAGRGAPLPGLPHSISRSGGSGSGSGAASVINDDDDGDNGSADGVPYANVPGNDPSPVDVNSIAGGAASDNPNNMKRAKKKNKKGDGRGASAPSPTGIGPTPRPPGTAVTDADRNAGLGHWADIMNNAENVDAIELDPAKRAAKLAAALSRQQAGAARQGGGRAAPAPGSEPMAGEPPTPMMESPSGSGDMVVDQVAYHRMYPGGAKLNLKAFKLKQQSAVSAAFELCVALEPKARPAFEFKDGKRPTTSPFTLHVVVNGVAYSPATANTIKLAKQLASINFLREAMGTRPQLNLESLIADAGGSAAGKAAVAAKINEVAKQPRPSAAGAAAAGGGDGEGGGVEGEGAAAMDGEGDESEDAVEKLALGSGEPNYAQILHDLVAAHPECPTYTSYSFKALKDFGGKKQKKVRGRGFRCTARLLRHTVDPVLTAQKQKEEAEKRAAEAIAKAAVAADPTNPELLEAARKAHKAVLRSRAVPMLNIKVLSATGDGASKRDAKHTAAQALIYLLLPGCKTEGQMRAMAKAIMDKYQAEKKARLEEEQKVAQKAKSLREKAKALNARAEAAAAAVDAAEAQADVARVHQPVGESRHDKAMRIALQAATKTSEVRLITGEPGISSSDSEGGGGSGSGGSGGA
ncbi:unnamed protein product, partial [Scytosiphon promiscuus]